MLINYADSDNGGKYILLCEQCNIKNNISYEDRFAHNIENAKIELKLLRVYGNIPMINLPDSISEENLFPGENIKIVSVGKYCFAQNSHLPDRYLKETESISDNSLTELAGRYVEYVILPDSVKELESYAFYNCRNLKSITVGKMLTVINNDAFMNCRNLDTVKIRADIKDKTGLKYILSQLNKNIEVLFIQDNKNNYGITAGDVFTEREHYSAGFYYPEYTESYEEIGPAHIFAMNVEGEGYRARQCFNEGVIDVAGYDAIFEQALAMENAVTLFMMAVDRLMYPTNLTQVFQKMYSDFIFEKGEEIMELVVKRKDMAVLKFLCAERLVSNDALKAAVRMSVQEGWTAGNIQIIRSRQ